MSGFSVVPRYSPVEHPPFLRTDAANAGLKTIATAAGGAIRLLGVTIRANAAITAELQYIALTAGDSQATELISPSDGETSAFTGIDKQASWAGSEAGVVLAAGSSLYLNFVPVAAGTTPTNFTVYIRYVPCDPGASLVTVP